MSFETNDETDTKFINDSNGSLTEIDNGNQARKQTESSKKGKKNDDMIIEISKTIQILIPITTATTEQFPSDMTGLWDGMSLNFETTNDSENLSEELPLIVVCPVLNRVQEDIKVALEGIKYDKPFIVLLIHSSLESSLPKLPTSTLLVNTEYQNVEFIDVAYNKEKRLYNCEMNERAKRQFESFLERKQMKGQKLYQLDQQLQQRKRCPFEFFGIPCTII